MIGSEDAKELDHLSHFRDGGWCLDGRKERRLFRLGYIEVAPGGRGWVTTSAGISALREYQQAKP